MRHLLRIAVAFCFPALGALVAQSSEALEAGRKQFEGLCAPCHGADGGGGERGPDIVSRRGARIRNEKDLSELIHTGIPDSGMPGFDLPAQKLQELTAFVYSLRAPAIERTLPGNAALGESFYQEKGRCSSCHMLNGRGGSTGPDLSDLGRERTLNDILRALRNPSAHMTPEYRVVSVELRNGRRIRGFAKNQSAYDMQLQDFEGALHLLRRDQIKRVAAEQKSLMPIVQASPEEFQNLLAFLSRLSRAEGPAPRGERWLEHANGGLSFTDLLQPKPGDWPTYHGRLSGNRHSPLRQIHTGNVAGLAPIWMFPIPNSQRLQVTPVVVDGIMYVTAANEAFALDARSGRQIWHYERPRTKGLVGDAAGAINRGVAVLGERVFMVTDNAHLIALHRVNGQLLWDVEMADYHQHYGATSAPLVVKDLVISGTSGGDEGARGFVAAYKASTGERVWRFWTVPLPGEPLAKTWIGRAIEHGCSTAWLTGTYDPETDTLFWTTGNPCPDYNGDERQGDNLYSDSVLALNPGTGELRWYYQFTPHDLHDWDAEATPMVIDAELHGKKRQLLVQANRNGFFYVLDRINGQFISATPFCEEINLGERHRSGWPPEDPARNRAHGSGRESLPCGGRGHELVLNGLQSRDRPVLCNRSREVQHLHEIIGMVGAGPIFLRRRHSRSARRNRAEDLARDRFAEREGGLGVSPGRVCLFVGRRALNCRRPGSLRRRQRRVRSGRCQDGNPSLAFPHQPAVEGFPDDLLSRGKAVRGGRSRPEHPGFRTAIG